MTRPTASPITLAAASSGCGSSGRADSGAARFAGGTVAMVDADRTEGLQCAVRRAWAAMLNGEGNSRVEAAAKVDGPRQGAPLTDLLAGTRRRVANRGDLAMLGAFGNGRAAIDAGSAPARAAVIAGIDRSIGAVPADGDAPRKTSR